MIEAITEYLMKWAEKRGRVFKITGTAGPDDVYLIRYYIVKSRFFNFFIHQFLRSDRDDLHDHPWSFVTYLVRGTYKERKFNTKTGQVDTITRMNSVHRTYWNDPTPIRTSRNTFVFRRAEDQHQVLVFKDYSGKSMEFQKKFAALTLCFTGPTKREWGFVRTIPHEPYCSSNVGCNDMTHGERVWVPWREYLGLPPDTPGRG